MIKWCGEGDRICCLQRMGEGRALRGGDILEQGTEGGEGARVPRRGVSKCKGPEMGIGDEIRRGTDHIDSLPQGCTGF